jgi:hypothetical protein
VPLARRSGLITLGLGGALALAAQLAAPVRLPLYDGVVVEDPYRYLAPGPGQAGSPATYSSEKAPEGGVSPAFVAATTENPPQAQLIAGVGAFALPAGATTMKISITAVPTTVTPTIGAIAGNVYRVAVTDGTGAALAITAATDLHPTLTLRVPADITDATIGHLTPSGWQLLPTSHGGLYALFSTNPGELGDFALINTAGGGASQDLGPLVGGAFALIVVAAVGTFLFVRRRRAIAFAEAAAARGHVPSRRKPPRPPRHTGRRSR